MVSDEMPCPSAAEGKGRVGRTKGRMVPADSANDEQLFQRLLKLCDAQGWGRKRRRVGGFDGDGSPEEGAGSTAKVQQRSPRLLDRQQRGAVNR